MQGSHQRELPTKHCEQDAATVWEKVSHFVEDHLQQGKSVVINGLGTFSFVPWDINLGNSFVTIRRPTFHLSEKIAQYFVVEQARKSLSSDTAFVQLNPSDVAIKAGLSRQAVIQGIEDVIRTFRKLLSENQDIDFVFHKIGRLQIKSKVAKAKFYLSFLKRINRNKIAESKLMISKPCSCGSSIISEESRSLLDCVSPRGLKGVIPATPSHCLTSDSNKEVVSRDEKVHRSNLNDHETKSLTKVDPKERNQVQCNRYECSQTDNCFNGSQSHGTEVIGDLTGHIRIQSLDGELCGDKSEKLSSENVHRNEDSEGFMAGFRKKDLCPLCQKLLTCAFRKPVGVDERKRAEVMKEFLLDKAQMAHDAEAILQIFALEEAKRLRAREIASYNKKTFESRQRQSDSKSLDSLREKNMILDNRIEKDRKKESYELGKELLMMIKERKRRENEEKKRKFKEDSTFQKLLIEELERQRERNIQDKYAKAEKYKNSLNTQIEANEALKRLVLADRGVKTDLQGVSVSERAECEVKKRAIQVRRCQEVQMAMKKLLEDEEKNHRLKKENEWLKQLNKSAFEETISKALRKRQQYEDLQRSWRNDSEAKRKRDEDNERKSDPGYLLDEIVRRCKRCQRSINLQGRRKIWYDF